MPEAAPAYLDLLNTIYAAALDDTQWQPALGALMRQVGASQSSLLDPLAGQITLLNGEFSPDYWPSYQAHYWQRDVWAQQALRTGQFTRGNIVHGDQLLERRDFHRTEIYNDLFKQNNIGVLLGTVLFDGKTPDEHPLLGLSLYRPPGAEAFHERDRALVRRLVPHFQRALRIRWQLSKREEARCLYEEALDNLGQAVALLDANGKVLFANRRAETIFRSGDVLTVTQGHLAAAKARDGGCFRESLRRAAVGTGYSLRLGSPAGTTLLDVTLCPLPAPHPPAHAAGRILVLITPCEPPTLEQATQQFLLGPHALSVLQNLPRLESIQELAEALHMDAETLRVHLGNLYAKTGTRTPRELLNLFRKHQFLHEEPNGSSGSGAYDG